MTKKKPRPSFYTRRNEQERSSRTSSEFLSHRRLVRIRRTEINMWPGSLSLVTHNVANDAIAHTCAPLIRLTRMRYNDIVTLLRVPDEQIQRYRSWTMSTSAGSFSQTVLPVHTFFICRWYRYCGMGMVSQVDIESLRMCGISTWYRWLYTYIHNMYICI